MLKPTYRCSQAVLYLVCRLAWQKCRNNQIIFFAFDNKYTMAFIDENITRIKNVENLADYKARKEDVSLISIDYDRVTTNLVLMATHLGRYIKRAFKEDKAILKIMLTTAGFSNFRQMQKLDEKAIAPFMSSAIKFVVEKTDILNHQGKMPADFIAQFVAADTQFGNILAAYNTADAAHKEKTNEKIIGNNDIHEQTLEMLADGHFMHMKSPEIAKQYKFNALLSQVEPTKNAGINGKILMPGGKRVISGVTVAESLTGKTFVSDKKGDFALNSLGAGTYTVIFSAEGFVTQTIMGVIVKKGATKRLKVEMQPV